MAPRYSEEEEAIMIDVVFRNRKSTWSEITEVYNQRIKMHGCQYVERGGEALPCKWRKLRQRESMGWFFGCTGQKKFTELEGTSSDGRKVMSNNATKPYNQLHQFLEANCPPGLLPVYPRSTPSSNTGHTEEQLHDITARHYTSRINPWLPTIPAVSPASLGSLDYENINAFIPGDSLVFPQESWYNEEGYTFKA